MCCCSVSTVVKNLDYVLLGIAAAPTQQITRGLTECAENHAKNSLSHGIARLGARAFSVITLLIALPLIIWSVVKTLFLYGLNALCFSNIKCVKLITVFSLDQSTALFGMMQYFVQKTLVGNPNANWDSSVDNSLDHIWP